MDAFYAAVEQLDNPDLRGLPILVAPPSARGVVLTASYEARPYGVGSAMPISRARRLCPQATIVPPRFERYQALSRIIMNVFTQFSPEVEPLSLDEAFLDMSGSAHIFGTPEEIGQQIKAAVFEATGGLTVSVGVSGTKYVAKVASAYRKPDGLTVVPQADARRWLAPQPVSRLWGAGPRTQVRLQALGLDTIGDVAACEPSWLRERLGATGAHFHALAHAEDRRSVEQRNGARSMASDRTLTTDVSRPEDILLHLQRAADSLGKRLRHKGWLAGGVRVKLKTAGFQTHTRQQQLNEPTDVAATLLAAGRELLRAFDHPGPFRLVGLAVYDLGPPDRPHQMGLFDTAPRQRALEGTLDRIADRFGNGSIRRARDLGHGLRADLNMDFLDDAHNARAQGIHSQDSPEREGSPEREDDHEQDF